ncbi:thiamine pyrophosphate-binding protein [Georgenia sp. 10Sc9-8]|uniref:Thiamine pyrophosphate-binding protein n=1 Tax=Georgenia halotolerans TaxID=3028317 RepID=A0ABT5TVU2_9MICO|nr:thiamine pyrophosphate-binding protein [Georgenia halotolerans]
MRLAEAVGRALAGYGVDHVFGVVGSGNFHLTNGLVAGGARFVAARHEGGAATMADAYTRTSGTPAAVSLHQGCGLTNAMTGIAEAAKSRTPMLVLAAEAATPTSNFAVDQAALAAAVGAVPARITSAATVWEETLEAVRTARDHRRTVVLNLPLDVLDLEIDQAAPLPLPPPPAPQQAGRQDTDRLLEALRTAHRPVFVAGRGARGRDARDVLTDLAERCGALLATSAVAKGLFRDHPWAIDVSGGFSSPPAADLIAGADLVVGWGCALNMWTMRHGRLIHRDATVVQVDDTAEALGVHRDLTFGVHGDVAATAAALVAGWDAGTGGPPGRAPGYRTPSVRQRLGAGVRWRDVPYEDRTGGGRIDPRTLSAALDELLPAERVLSVDSGNFMGYPSMFLAVPDEQGFCFTQAFQSVGLGLATGIGAALARPDRLPVAALGDGGALMGAAELDTVRRLGLPMVVIVYNDDAYGAEVHHFRDSGAPLHTVVFPPTDIAAVAAGHGFTAVTVRGPEDLSGVTAWLAGPRDTPLLVDAKVHAEEPSWWLAEAFGH